jgi:hypothetical protein
VRLTDENVPLAVGVPVKVMADPLTAAVRPTGNPLAACNMYGPVPSVIGIEPVNPDRFIVQLAVDKEPRLSPALIVMV